MGMTLAPDYASSRALYLCYGYDSGDGIKDRVVRYATRGSLADRAVIVEDIPAARNHAGMPPPLRPDGMLYVTTGDATDRHIAQDLKSLGGKTLRVKPDGSIRRQPVPGSRSSRTGTATRRA
jgi:glucose/arabinose dehydrogenase